MLRLRKFLADTLTMVIFSTVGGMFVEVIITGMTVTQSIQSRIAGCFINLLTAAPYGMYRDWVFRITGAIKGHWSKKLFFDIVAFGTFQVPMYVVVLLLAGATRGQIITACSTITVFSLVIGRPYGMLMELVRTRVFGIIVTETPDGSMVISYRPKKPKRKVG